MIVLTCFNHIEPCRYWNQLFLGSPIEHPFCNHVESLKISHNAFPGAVYRFRPPLDSWANPAVPPWFPGPFCKKIRPDHTGIGSVIAKWGGLLTASFSRLSITVHWNPGFKVPQVSWTVSEKSISFCDTWCAPRNINNIQQLSIEDTRFSQSPTPGLYPKGALQVIP